MIKKLTYILILLSFCSDLAFAQPQKAGIEYSRKPYESIYSDANKSLRTARSNMLLWENAVQKSQKKMYLEQAMRFYYLAIKSDNSLIEAHVGMARIYDSMDMDRYAKEYFYKALNISPNDASANLYFGNFYYRRDDFLNALKYYKMAYKNVGSNSYELNYRLGTIYEKLADIETAIAFYSQALRIKPDDKTLFEKIRLLDELNYADSQYYLFKKENKQ